MGCFDLLLVNDLIIFEFSNDSFVWWMSFVSDNSRVESNRVRYMRCNSSIVIVGHKDVYVTMTAMRVSRM